MSGITFYAIRNTFYSFVLFFLFSLPVYAQTPQGVLTGQVINGATNQPQGNITVTLRAFSADNAVIGDWTSQADSAGRYTFANLPTDHTTVYVVEGQYQKVTYHSSDPAIFTPNSVATTLNLTVYDTTAEVQTLGVGQFHLILTFSPGAVNVVQLFIVTNSGNRTYIGAPNGGGQTFAFALPSNAVNIDFQEETPGARFKPTANGYADTVPLIPNAENMPIAARYTVPFEADTLSLAIPLPADTASLNVLQREQGVRLTGDGLQFSETRQIQGETYQIFGGKNFKKGDLTLNLTGLDNLTFIAAPSATPAVTAEPPVNQTLLRWLVIGLGALAIVGAVVYALRRPQNDPQTHRQHLLLTLAGLDKAFESGKIEETVYRQARARTKAELTRIWQND